MQHQDIINIRNYSKGMLWGLFLGMLAGFALGLSFTKKGYVESNTIINPIMKVTIIDNQQPDTLYIYTLNE